jgi:hypothetical protein
VWIETHLLGVEGILAHGSRVPRDACGLKHGGLSV